MAHDQLPVQHDPAAQRFSLDLDGQTAYVHYAPPAPPPGESSTDTTETTPAVIRFDYVFVPPSHRGKGVNSRLLKSAFDHARSAGWTVKATCPYIRDAWLPRHPEVHDLLV